MAKDVFIITSEAPREGKEKQSLEHLGKLVEYLEGQKKAGVVASHELIALDESASIGGIVIVRGERAKIDAMRNTEEFRLWMIRGERLFAGLGMATGWTGEGAQEQLALHARP